jgi:acylphosphatase
MAAVRADLIIKGRVQGVCYRMETEDAARRIGGLTGWVRNKRDGSVEVMVEGEKEKIEQLIAWCWKGPMLAKVMEIKTEWLKPTGEFRDFRTTYTS